MKSAGWIQVYDSQILKPGNNCCRTYPRPISYADLPGKTIFFNFREPSAGVETERTFHEIVLIYWNNKK